MTKEKYMALADLQTVWTNTLKPWIVAGFIAVTAVESGATPQLVLQDGSLLPQSTFQAAGSYVTTSQMGANSGVATLDANGLVPSSQLPGYVDDVIEVANFAALPATGEGGKIYVTLDDNKTYRWGGSVYVEISASVALGETNGTAYEGSKGAALKTAYDTHAADTDIHVTAALQTAWNAKYDKPSGGIPKTDLAQAVQDVLDAAPVAITANPESLTSAQCEALTVGDQVVKEDASGKHVYTVTYKSATGMCLTYADAENVETIAYDKADDTWSKTDKTVTGIATAASKADSAIQSVKVNGTALTPDADKAVNVTFEIPERVTAQELAAFTA